METPVGYISNLYKQLATVVNQLSTVANNINEVAAKNVVHQGQIEILMGLVVKNTGKDEFINHLKFVAEHPNFSKEAKFAAKEMLRQESLWPSELLEGPKQ